VGGRVEERAGAVLQTFGQLALAGLEAAIRLVDDVSAPATTDHAVVAMTVLEGLQGIANLHVETSSILVVPERRERL
jgi:hypothetical protein